MRCDATDKRQSLEINWDGGNNFHLDKIINSVICFDDPTSSRRRRPAPWSTRTQETRCSTASRAFTGSGTR